jgi:hypothetical protein
MSVSVSFEPKLLFHALNQALLQLPGAAVHRDFRLLVPEPHDQMPGSLLGLECAALFRESGFELIGVHGLEE